MTRKPSLCPASVQDPQVHLKCLTSSLQWQDPAAWICPALCPCQNLGWCSQYWALEVNVVGPPPLNVRWNEVGGSPTCSLPIPLPGLPLLDLRDPGVHYCVSKNILWSRSLTLLSRDFLGSLALFLASFSQAELRSHVSPGNSPLGKLLLERFASYHKMRMVHLIAKDPH